MKSWTGALAGLALVAGGAQAAAPQTYPDSWSHYQALKAAARGGQAKRFEALPDWTGVWARAGGFTGLNWDTNQPRGGRATAVLTPEYQKRYDQRLADLTKGIEHDPLAECLPAGHPRFLAEPYSREFILRPEESWLVLEEGNEVRRIYTDGRPHLPDDEANPEPEGDSIGFWDGDALVIHTNHLRGGQYQKNQPDYSDQITSVERIRKVSPTMIEDDITLYDPLSLAKPWRVTAKFEKITNVPNARLNYWPCVENNRAVVKPDGTVDLRLPDQPAK